VDIEPAEGIDPGEDDVDHFLFRIDPEARVENAAPGLRADGFRQVVQPLLGADADPQAELVARRVAAARKDEDIARVGHGRHRRTERQAFEGPGPERQRGAPPGGQPRRRKPGRRQGKTGRQIALLNVGPPANA